MKRFIQESYQLLKKEGIITLFPPKNKPRDFIQNCIPITLLNVEYNSILVLVLLHGYQFCMQAVVFVNSSDLIHGINANNSELRIGLYAVYTFLTLYGTEKS